MLRKPYDIKTRDISGLFFKKLVSKIPDLIFQLSLSPNGELSSPYFNKAVIQYFELSRNELRNFDLSQRIIEEDFLDLIHSIQNISEKSTVWAHEFRAFLPTKGLRWFKAVANVEIDEFKYTTLFGRLSDITEQKQREIELQISEERFQFAMEASSNGVWDIDMVTDKVFYSSQSMKMLELDEHDIVDSHSKWDDRIHPDDVAEFHHQFNLHFEGKTPFYENAKRMLTKSGNYKLILSRGKIIKRDQSGKALRMIGTDIDITHQKEEEKKLLKSFYIISEQNSRLLNFAHIVSHNLNSHTGNFKMLLDLIDEENNQQTTNEVLGYLRTSSNALNQTIEHLKELVDINTQMIHKKENLNLNMYINKVLDILNNDISKNKVKIFNKISKQCYIDFNPSYLESILLNFTTNAIKYSHPERIPEINYSHYNENGKLVLEIQDNGLGIDLDRHGDKLFGMYKTFHNNEDARGIGLFITKNQIESMGGTVTVDSIINSGTTFKIYFNNEI